MVFEEDMSETGASSVLSDDSFPAAKGGNGNGGNGSGDGGCFDAGSHEQDDAVVAVAAVYVPSRGQHADNDGGDGGAASKVAQPGAGTASAHLSSSTGSRTESSTLYSVSPGAPGRSEVGWDDTAMVTMGRARPVESLLPVARSSSASVQHQVRRLWVGRGVGYEGLCLQAGGGGLAVMVCSDVLSVWILHVCRFDAVYMWPRVWGSRL